MCITASSHRLVRLPRWDIFPGVIVVLVQVYLGGVLVQAGGILLQNP